MSDLARLPHGVEARLVSRIVETHADRITCEAMISCDSPWLVVGRCPAFVAVEAAAQAAALLAGEQVCARAGSLVRVRKVVCSRPDLPVGVPFLVAAQRAGSAPPLFVFAIEAGDARGSILTGQIGIHIDFAESSFGHISAKQNH